jgi:hypothetical protein
MAFAVLRKPVLQKLLCTTPLKHFELLLRRRIELRCINGRKTKSRTQPSSACIHSDGRKVPGEDSP